MPTRAAPAARASASAAVEQRRPDAAPAGARAHAQAAELRRAARLDQQPARPDDAVVDGDEVQRLAVAAVAVALERDALLAAEDLLAQREGGGELALVAGPADLDRHQDR